MDALKLHLRVVDVGDYTYRVLTLRPQMGVRYSTNFFHETWHILTDEAGSKTLGRLFWGLSYQKTEGTIVVIDVPHLVTTPFDGDPADRILIAPTTTSMETKRLLVLRDALARRPRSDGTVRLQTFSLESEAERDDRPWRESRPERKRIEPLYDQERMDRRAGMVCYSAPAEILRAQGAAIYRMAPDKWGAYHYLDWGRSGQHHANGEVQVFTNFADRVSAAKVVRREMLGDGAKTLIGDQEIRWDVQNEVYYAQERRVKARVRRARELTSDRGSGR